MAERRRVAIVTGGGRGIGRAAATALAADGMAVAVVARTEGQIEKAAAEMRAAGGDSVAVAGDVAEPGGAEEVVEAVRRRLGRQADVLVNAAGIGGPVDELADVDPGEWRRTLEINLTGAFEMCRAVVPAMREQGWGRIVNLISGLAHRVQVGIGAYSVSKAGLLHLSRVVDAEERERGIRVFAIEPGLVDSDMSRELRSARETRAQRAVVEMLGSLEDDPGFVEPEEPAQLIRLVASGGADDLAGEPHSIYDPSVRARVSTHAAA
jgi:NAD(P)-dependent dehydrogenase (short-subunit alcohol dehydrogenase family)